MVQDSASPLLFAGAAGDIVMVMYGPPGGPYELRVIPQFVGLPSEWLRPNVAPRPVVPGTWHRIEWLLAYKPTTAPATASCGGGSTAS